MYKTVVIPLDTSEVAEAVLPYIRGLTKPQQSRLVLIHSIEPQEYAYVSASTQPNVYSKLLDTIESGTLAYLANLQEEFQAEGYAVTLHVARGDAAQFIVDVAVQEKADLIAMTTHGRTGFARWALGSVADRVIRTAYQPVFLVRSNLQLPTTDTPQRILVPLDGSEIAESAVEQAQMIAESTGATLVLFRVIEPLTKWEKQLLDTGQSSDSVIVERVDAARSYLQLIAHRLQIAGIPTTEHLFTGTPAEAILKIATDEQVDLIVMSTHGYGGYTRWVYGSVANMVLHNANCPLLLNRSFPQAATIEQ